MYDRELKGNARFEILEHFGRVEWDFEDLCDMSDEQFREIVKDAQADKNRGHNPPQE